MKTAIIYYSKHHGNTKKLLDKIAASHPVTLINVSDGEIPSLDEFEVIGFASGIYYSKFHKSVLKAAKEKLPQRKKVFFIYTYGVKKEGYTDAVKSQVLSKNAEILGEYGCLGFNTFGPFRLIGGIAKNHPNEEELLGAEKFFAAL